MQPTPPVQSQPATAAEAYLGLLAARGVEYLFANGGTDFAPVVEAYARGKTLGWRLPEPVIVPHENMGVAMAHGFTMVSGRAQAMMVHVGMGTANAINGLINAARMNIPMLFTAGRTPLTESGAVPGARNNYIHWAQEHFDQGAMLREFMKWDYELRHAEQVETAVDRALAIARSEPQGPVYLTLPREILASPFAGKTSASATQVTASPPGADPDVLEEAASLLARAERPLLITANAGRTADTAKAIAHLCEAFGIPVVHYRPRYFALSTEHPMHAGWEPHALLREADVVLVGNITRFDSSLAGDVGFGRGAAAVEIQIIETAKPERPLYKATVTEIYPPDDIKSSGIDTEATPEEIESALLAALAKKIAQLFYAHPPER